MKCSNCTNNARTIYDVPGVVAVYYCGAHTPIGLPVRLLDPPYRPGLEPPPEPPVEPEEPSPEVQTVPPDMTVSQTLSWIGEDTGRAQEALDEEQNRETPRKTLLTKLNDLLG